MSGTDFLVEGSDYRVSLSKLVGKNIKDIHVMITNAMFGDDYQIKLSRIVFEDGTDFLVEGEHDWPYVTFSERVFPDLTEENLSQIAKDIDDSLDRSFE